MIAAIALAAQLKGTFDLSGTLGTQVRELDPPPIITVPRPEKIVVGADLLAIATGRVTLGAPRWSLALTLAPALTIQDFELGSYATIAPPNSNVTAVSTGRAVVAQDRLFSITLLESAAVARILLNQAALYPYQQGVVGGQPAALPTVPSATTTSTGNTFVGDGGAAALIRPGRVTTLTMTADFMYSGGLDETTRAVVPGQWSPRGLVSITHGLTPLDTAGVLVTGVDTVTNGPCPPPKPAVPFCNVSTPIVQAEGTWRRTLSREGTLSLFAGVAGTVEDTDTETDLFILPVGGATYVHRFGAGRPQNQEQTTTDKNASAADATSPPKDMAQPTKEAPAPSESAVQPVAPAPDETQLPAGSRLDDVLGVSDLTTTVQLAPAVDARTGLASTRVTAMMILSKPLTRSLVVAGNLAATQSVPLPRPEPYPLTLLTVACLVRIHMSREVDLNLSAQELLQNQTGYGNLRSTVGLASLIVREPTLRLW